MRQVVEGILLSGGIIMRSKRYLPHRRKEAYHYGCFCKTREELLLILQLYYKLNWMKSRIRLADVG